MAVSVDALIVGGGIAGLSAAYELARRDVRFMLIEAAPRLGGLILTERLDSFIIDAGPDALLAQKPAALDLCRELGIAHRLIPINAPRTAYVLCNGRLHPLPAESTLGFPTRLWPLATTGLFSFPGKMRMAVELCVPRRRGPDDESIAGFVRRRFGEEAVRRLAEPLLVGIHAGDAERLSVRALFPRLVDAEAEHGSIIRAFRTLRTAAAQEGAFRSFPEGLEELVGALVRTLPPDALRTSTAAEVISGTGPFTVRTVPGELLSASTLILATPAWETARLIERLDASLAAYCRQIPYHSSATIVLAYPRAAVHHPLEGSGFIVPHAERLRILAASWVSSKWPNRAPPSDVLLRAFVGGARDPDLVEREDGELVRIVRDELDAILAIEGRPMLQRVYRWRRANAQHEVGHLERLAKIEQQLAIFPGLYVTGSGFRGVGIPDCIADARATAARVADFVKTAGVTG